MADSSLTSRAITAAACSSLKLTSSSTGLLSLPQLIAIESELCTTLNIIRSQIRAELSGMFSMFTVFTSSFVFLQMIPESSST